MYSLILQGRRSLVLQKWCNLRFVVKLVQNTSSFPNSFSSARYSRKGHSFTVSYLVESLGLPTKLAESISKKVSFEDKGNPDSVLNLLKTHGFTDSQISSMVTDYPRLLIEDAEKSLGPKFQFLLSRGASSSELTEIVSKVPEILRKKSGKGISRYYDFIKEIVEADKSSKFEKLGHSLPQGKQENKIRNVMLLRELGMPQKMLFSLLISDFEPVCGKERFGDTVKKVIEMGFDPTKPKFVVALRIVYGFSDKTLDEKVNAYNRLGLDVDEIWELFKKWPTILAYSEEKILNSIETFQEVGISRDEFAMMVKRYPQCIGFDAESVKKKTDFLVKKMNWPLKTVVKNPSVLGYNLEKRIVPRCNVIEALMSKGLLGDGESELRPMSSMLAITDQALLNKYVMKHDDKKLVAELMSILTRDQKILGKDSLGKWSTHSIPSVA